LIPLENEAPVIDPSLKLNDGVVKSVVLIVVSSKSTTAVAGEVVLPNV
jgi:hypothetical protein